MKKKIAIFILSLLFCIPIFSGCNETIYDHQIFVTSSDIRLGSVNGDGIYKTNQIVKLTATQKSDENKFVCWIKDNEVVSNEFTYEFTATKQTEGKYTAVFYSPNSNFLYLEKIILIPNSVETSYELNELIITLSNKEIFNNNSLNILLSNNSSPEEFEIESKNVYNKNNEIGLTVTTRINNSVVINNAIFTITDESLIQVDFNLNVNINNASLKLSLVFKPLGFNEGWIYPIFRNRNALSV